ncbi:helix-turn-helix domain-containing protein [Larkinella harenae]
MDYREHQPATNLIPFVDCFWTLQTPPTSAVSIRRIVPDICTDVIYNLGEAVPVWNGEAHLLKPEKLYLMGTMTTFQSLILEPGTNLVGIRFKPFGLSALLGIRQQGMVNRIEELDGLPFSLDSRSFQPSSTTQERSSGFEKINNWLLRYSNGADNTAINALVGTLLSVQGRITVRDVAHQYCTTEKQLERKFGGNLGISLKEICNLIRFQHAYALVGQRERQSLLDIAFQAGYYDHAHLTRHFKRYAGHPPSHLS